MPQVPPLDSAPEDHCNDDDSNNHINNLVEDPLISRPISEVEPNDRRTSLDHLGDTSNTNDSDVNSNANSSSSGLDVLSLSESDHDDEIPIGTNRNDVLGGRKDKHPGNIRLTHWVRERSEKYHNESTSRKENTNMIRAIIAMVHDAGGRFLTEEWKVLTETEAHEKISSKFRYEKRKPERKRKHSDREEKDSK